MLVRIIETPFPHPSLQSPQQAVTDLAERFNLGLSTQEEVTSDKAELNDIITAADYTSSCYKTVAMARTLNAKSTQSQKYVCLLGASILFPSDIYDKPLSKRQMMIRDVSGYQNFSTLGVAIILVVWCC